MTLEHLVEKRNSSSALRIISHFLFWATLFISSYYLIKISFSPYKDTPLAFLAPLRNTVGLIVVYYPLVYILLPQFIEKKRWVIFVASFSLFIFFYIFIEALGEKMTFYFCDTCRVIAENNNADHLSVLQKGIVDNILYKSSSFGLFLNIFSSLVLPIAIKTSLGYYQYYTRNLSLEKEKVQLKLNFLKAQVNPHFLFNTLNNLFGLIIHKRIDESAETVTRLSDYLRYSLENADRTDIFLSEEIRLLKNYIQLEGLRLNHTKVSFNTNADEYDKSIPPLLFIPLVENAFKYNVDKKGTKIMLDVILKDNVLYFNMHNAFNSQERRMNIGGLGLSNLIKRLDLYFKDKYEYHVAIEDSIYKVYLKLELK